MTKPTMFVTGTLEIIQKLKYSYLGNPRYLVKVGDEVLYTSPNSSFGYSVSNYNNRAVKVGYQMHYGKPSIVYIEETE